MKISMFTVVSCSGCVHVSTPMESLAQFSYLFLKDHNMDLPIRTFRPFWGLLHSIKNSNNQWQKWGCILHESKYTVRSLVTKLFSFAQLTVSTFDLRNCWGSPPQLYIVSFVEDEESNKNLYGFLSFLLFNKHLYFEGSHYESCLLSSVKTLSTVSLYQFRLSTHEHLSAPPPRYVLNI